MPREIPLLPESGWRFPLFRGIVRLESYTAIPNIFVILSVSSITLSF
jgi:hypothetical protein